MSKRYSKWHTSIGPLTENEAKWIEEYLKTGNILEATRAAFPKHTKGTQYSYGYEIFRRPRVVVAICKRQGLLATFPKEYFLLQMRDLMEDHEVPAEIRFRVLTLAMEMTGLSPKSAKIDKPSKFKSLAEQNPEMSDDDLLEAFDQSRGEKN